MSRSKKILITLILAAALSANGEIGAQDKYNLPPEQMEAEGYYQAGSGNARGLSAREISRTVREHIRKQEKLRGFFLVNDPLLRRSRRVSEVKTDKKPVKEGDRYYVRSVVRDMDNNELLLVDTYVEKIRGQWEVVGQLIKKQAGKVRKPGEIGELPENK